MVDVKTKEKSDYLEQDSSGEVCIYIFVKDVNKFFETLKSGKIPSTKEVLPDGRELEVILIDSTVKDIKIKFDVEEIDFELEKYDEAPEGVKNAFQRAKGIVVEAYNNLEDSVAVYWLYVDGMCMEEST